MKLTGIALALAAAFVAPAMAQDKISIKGSDTLGAKVVPMLTETYRALGNNVKFEVAAEGSSQAFKALLDGTAEIGMSSRSVKDDEINKFTSKGQQLVEHVACVDMITIIVNPSNSVKSLTKEQVEGIFTGSIKDWSEVGGTPGAIAIFTRNETSGTFKDFQKLAMKDKDYASNVQKQAGNTQIVDQVKSNPKGIGYVGFGYSKSKGVTPAVIDGIPATAETKKQYPYARSCYYYTIGQPSGEAGKFLTWAISSKAAAKVVDKAGFIPNEN
jgi:phosphate transport system substrate-binding protein